MHGDIDLAVHSMKDVPASVPNGLAICAVLAREDPRDAFISLKYGSLADLPRGATVGTSSPRRRAQVLRLRPDLNVVEFRGNVETRLRKLEARVADATFLACAGLNRLTLSQHITERMHIDDMLPAVAQGAVGVEIRAEDLRTAALLAPLNDKPTSVCVAAERAFLARLEGSCRTPIAGYADLRDGALHIRGEILTPDGRERHAAKYAGTAQAGISLGAAAAAALLGACRTSISSACSPDMQYQMLKFLHVLGVILLIGNVTITAFWKVFADRSNDPLVIAEAQRIVILADWFFTLAGIVLILVRRIRNARCRRGQSARRRMAGVGPEHCF